MRAHNAVQPVQDVVVDDFNESIHTLTNVWMSMLWLSTSNTRVISTRREIARWTRNCNQGFMDIFGRATASEEIRVLLDGMVTSVPQQLGDTGRDFLSRAGAEARDLAVEGQAALDAV